MSHPPISHKDLTPTLVLSECHDGFWLYDETRGMNLSMRAKTAEAALVEALGYYQEQLKKIKLAYWSLKWQVDAFVSQVTENEEP